MLSISSVFGESSIEDRGEPSRTGLQGQSLQYVNFTNQKSQTFANSGTYEAARGLVRRGRSGLLSISHTELSIWEPLTFLGAFASGSGGAALFFLPTSGGESFSSFSSSSSSSDEEEVSSSDDMSEAPFWQGPFLAPLAAFLAVFSGTSYGAGNNIFVRSGNSSSSGSGAGQLI